MSHIEMCQLQAQINGLEYRITNLAENVHAGGELSRAILEHLGLEWKYVPAVPEIPATHKLVKKEKK